MTRRWTLLQALLVSVFSASCLAPSVQGRQAQLESTVAAMQTDVAIELSQLRDLVSTPPALPTDVPPPSVEPSAAVESEDRAESVVTADILNLRSGPGLEYEVVGHLQRGDTVQARARLEGGDWIKIASDAGLEGWVATEFVDLRIPMTDIPLAVQLPATPAAGSTVPATASPTAAPSVSVTPSATSASP